MRQLFLLAAAFLALSLSAAAVNVSVSSPSNNSQVGTSFTVNANASSSTAIVGWHIYIDGNNVYGGGQTGSISASLSAGAGTHQVVTRAWDATGAYGDVYQTITVSGSGSGGSGGSGGGNGLPNPPSGAIVFTNIQNRGGWTACNWSSCSGGSGRGAYWMAQHQGNPSQTGSSTEFFNSGVWDNALWFQKLGPNNNVHNFLWDFYFYVDGNSWNGAQALEFDAFHFVGGWNYMIGSQCDYGRGAWDTWDESSGHWIPSSVGCPKMAPNTWHHVQWYVTTNTNSHQYSYVTLVVDGQSHAINTTRNAKYLGWSDNLGVQWQLDVNGSGQGYHEWVDNAKLTVW